MDPYNCFRSFYFKNEGVVMKSNGKDSLKQNTYQTIKISDLGIESYGEIIDGINVSNEFEEEYEKLSITDKRKVVIGYFMDFNHITFISRDTDKHRIYVGSSSDRLLIVDNATDEEEKLLYDKYKNDRLNFLASDNNNEFNMEFCFEDTSSYSVSGIYSDSPVTKYYISCGDGKLPTYEKEFIREFLNQVFNGEKAVLIEKQHQYYIIGNGVVVTFIKKNRDLISELNRYNKEAIKLEKKNKEQMKLQMKMEGF